MIINYNSYALRKITGTNVESFPVKTGISVNGLIGRLSEKYGSKFMDSLLDQENKRLKMIILVNGESVSDIEYKIKDGDTLNILSLITGG